MRFLLPAAVTLALLTMSLGPVGCEAEVDEEAQRARENRTARERVRDNPFAPDVVQRLAQQDEWLDVPPEGSLVVRVIARDRQWRFGYGENGREAVASELRVPAGRLIRLAMTSEEGMHALNIRSANVRQEVVPGANTFANVEFREPGEHQVMCSGYCGGSHAARVIVMEPEAFEQWLAEAKRR